MPVHVIDSVYQRLNMFNINNPTSALNIYREAPQALKDAIANGEQCENEKPLRELISRAEQTLSDNYLNAKQTMENYARYYGVIKPKSPIGPTWSAHLMDIASDAKGWRDSTPAQQANYGGVMAIHENAKLKLNNFIHSLRPDIDYFSNIIDFAQINVLTKTINDVRTAVDNNQNHEYLSDMPTSYSLAIALHVVLDAYESLPPLDLFPQARKKIEESKQTFVNELLPQFAELLLRIIKTSPSPIHEAGVIREALGDKIKAQKDDIRPALIGLFATLRDTEIKPFMDAFNFVQEAEEAGFRPRL